MIGPRARLYVMNLRSLLLLAAIAVVALGPRAAEGQYVERIAAIVNDDVISMFDLNTRIQLVVVSTRLDNSSETRRRLAPQVLRSLINERLQLQEAKKRNISVSKREVGRALSVIEEQNNIPKGKLNDFLQQNGIEPQTLTDQIRAGLAWRKLIQRRLRPRISIGDEEVDEALTRLANSRGQVSYRFSEIFLAVDTRDEETQVRSIATRMVRQIRNGARFDALARQFSQSATAAVGGDLGWIREGELDDALKPISKSLKIGQVSDPLRRVTGYQIVMLRERRVDGAGDPGAAKISLNQIFLPLAGNAPEADKDTQMSLAQTLRDTVSGCADMAEVSKELRSPRPPTLGTFEVSSLAPNIRDAVATLEVGQMSTPLDTGDGLLLLMVCERDDPAVKLPERADIEDQLVRQRVDLMARRYLRDIRLAAIVDIRV